MMQGNEEIRVAREHRTHGGLGVDLLLQTARHLERDVLFVAAAAADGAFGAEFMSEKRAEARARAGARKRAKARAGASLSLYVGAP